MKETRIICDVCRNPIENAVSRQGRFFFTRINGVRYTKRFGIFGSEQHADICSECQKKLFKENA